MKNKKGFTLIELLAVIVILAIIALIAVPIILNMIENAKKGAAKDSAYGYIEAVETYQAYEMLKGNVGLKEGIYNIVEETTIDNTKYKKLTELIKVKGTNPTGGKLGITKNGTVGSATMCVNDYVVEYINNKVELISEDCGEMGAIISYNISSEEWETKKTLEILYPEGQYEYYYKLESGKATIDGIEIVIGEEIKLETNTINIELLENSKITAWMVKKGKKISTKIYEETKIDNTEIGVPTLSSTAGYPKLTDNGIKITTTLSMSYEEQEGVSPYYSIDGGKTWTKYTQDVSVDALTIQGKLVKDKNNRAGEIVTINVSAISGTLGTNAYDGDETTYVEMSRSNSFDSKTPIYILCDKNMWGKNMNVLGFTANTDGASIQVSFFDENDNYLERQAVAGKNFNGTSSIVIPNDTAKIRFFKYYTYAKGYVYEVGVDKN